MHEYRVFVGLPPIRLLHLCILRRMYMPSIFFFFLTPCIPGIPKEPPNGARTEDAVWSIDTIELLRLWIMYIRHRKKGHQPKEKKKRKPHYRTSPTIFAASL